MRSNFKSSTLYYSLAVLIAVVAIMYGLLQYKVMQAQAQAIVNNNSAITALVEKNKKLKEYYSRFAASQTEVQKKLSQALDDIIPIGEHYTDLTRVFDAFFAQHDSAKNPIVQSSLRFGKGTPVEGIPSIGALPITMNIEGTRANFFAFLQFINNSGTFTEHNRLIAINSIQLNFPDGGEVLKNQYQVINFTVEMTAYYRIK